MSEMIGTLLNNRYRLNAEIGRGGMAVVYHAHDKLLDRDVAVKVLSATALNAESRARVLREAQAAAKLNHPNIVSVHDAGEAEGVPFIVMELIEGQSLHSRRPQALEEILSIVQQVCAALEHAHTHGIVHRDLKPENVLIAPDGCAKLMDFGLARTAASRLTTEGAIVGTVFYLAPEQVLGQEIDNRTDLYALGVLLYELMTGQLPFTGDNMLAVISQHLHAPVVPPSTHNAAIPPALDALIVRLLSKQPEDRPASASEVRQALDDLSHPEAASATPVSPQTAARKHNLPVQLTPFIGREAALAEIADCLQDPACRLLTLVGPGGSGKTRLALEAAKAQVDNFAHGVFFISLAPLDSTEAIVPTVAEAIGFRFYEEGEPQQQMLDYLRQKTMLLILDNFEHLLDGVGVVTDVLKTAPDVKTLTTSRARLNVQGEHLFPVTGMSFPDEEATEDASQYSAVRLFLTSARRAQPSFELTTDNLTHVVRICRLVQGMPLSILLAAAWVEMLTPAEIAAEIGQSLDFLETDLHDVPERQRSMRAVFDHSWRLLTEREREVFQGLSVFRGGFTRQPAGQVTGASLRELMALVNKSLLHRMPTGRYEVHELLRQYAAEKLDDSPAASQAARDRHAAYYAAALQAWAADLKGPRQQAAMAEIEADSENVRAAWNWAIERGQVDRLEQAMDGLCRFYEWRGLYPEVIAAAQAAIHLAQAAQDVCGEARGYLWWGRTLWRQGDYKMARFQLEQALTLARAAQLRQVEADSLRNLGIISHQQADDAGAIAYYQQALHIYREIGDQPGESALLNNLGNVSADQGDDAGARAYYEQSLRICREIGDRHGDGMVLGNLGIASYRLGDYAGAMTYYEQSLRIYREIGDRRGEGMTLAYLGLLSHHLGDDEAAREYSQQALLIGQELGNRHIQGYALTNLGHALVGMGRLTEADDAYQQALDLRRELGQHHLATEPLAGLARVSLAQGHLPQAQVEEILSHLENQTLDGTDEPFRVYLTCYRVLRANEDPRAQAILDTAYNLLQEQAAKISDEEMRRSFLENVAAHREVMCEFTDGNRPEKRG